MMSAEVVVVAFNDCINARDVSGLGALMTDDHAFVDSANTATRGKADCVRAWTRFFAAFPDYRNRFERIVVDGNVVAIAGRSECSDARLSGPALWSATVRDNQVAKWRVYEDIAQNRAALAL